jgi:5-methylcytosine-specific restriction endonuclease McrA
MFKSDGGEAGEAAPARRSKGAVVKLATIKKHLRSQTIMRRKSTIANAFASALAPFDDFDQDEVAKAVRDLGQDPEGDLSCVYCGAAAATWDHIFNRVVGGEFSGHGHRIRNLVPSCRTCNERKGQKPWREWLRQVAPPDEDARAASLEKFLSRTTAAAFTMEDMRHHARDELERFLEVRSQVFSLLVEADELAAVIRNRAREAHQRSDEAARRPS